MWYSFSVALSSPPRGMHFRGALSTLPSSGHPFLNTSGGPQAGSKAPPLPGLFLPRGDGDLLPSPSPFVPPHLLEAWPTRRRRWQKRVRSEKRTTAWYSPASARRAGRSHSEKSPRWRRRSSSCTRVCRGSLPLRRPPGAKLSTV